ncbi:MAG TPA: trehalose-6-phosphate synthase [Actinomycetota bacterium]|jgi:trehalose 6-phosphate synthase|nr:trehalose-6-phosphate synthase [Actinomycetota bacterium]
MSAGRVLVASNRGPVTFVPEGDDLVARRGAGGLVSALSSALQTTGGLWVSSAMSPGDRARAARSADGRIEVITDDAKFHVRLLTFEDDTYDLAYNEVSNRILWFLHHHLWDLPRTPTFDSETRRAWEAYRRYNQVFAGALAEEAGAEPAVALVQDYHLCLVPRALRELAPATRIAHFHHSPFAGPDELQLLPEPMWRELLEGLLGADLLGFHTHRWARNFLSCCRLLEGATCRRRSVQWRDRTVRLGVFPISIDAEALRERARAAEVREKQEELLRWLDGRALVLRVDRTDLSKNILRGFLAYGDFLRRNPEWRGKVVFLALLNPSRQRVPEYRIYMEQLVEAARAVNREFGEPGWQPLELRIGDDWDEVVAAYGIYDALLVNPVFDGMNLVAKEGPLLNARDGVLLLSPNAGAFAELGDHALPVDPLDVAGTADVLDAALRMSPEERKRRAAALRRAAGARTPARWASSQLRRLGRLAPPGS